MMGHPTCVIGSPLRGPKWVHPIVSCGINKETWQIYQTKPKACTNEIQERDETKEENYSGRFFSAYLFLSSSKKQKKNKNWLIFFSLASKIYQILVSSKETLFYNRKYF